MSSRQKKPRQQKTLTVRPVEERVREFVMMDERPDSEDARRDALVEALGGVPAFEAARVAMVRTLLRENACDTLPAGPLSAGELDALESIRVRNHLCELLAEARKLRRSLGRANLMRALVEARGNQGIKRGNLGLRQRQVAKSIGRNSGGPPVFELPGDADLAGSED